jgi:adenosylcobyric acid synthase
MSRAKCIMVQGTMSGAGKSLLCAALCRIFHQDGYRVAPFKSQNMALNSYITQDGLEMGRAQVMQAEAAGIKPDVRMNPILLKPCSDTGSQVIVCGRVKGQMPAKEYFRYKKKLIPDILQAYHSLAEDYDIIVIEGAGSPAEINLKTDDIVNMGFAKMVDAPVLLVGDIDRGGVFAQLYGTTALLEPDEYDRIRGLVINKFRGDRSILEPGLDMLVEKTGIPVVGVVPYLTVDVDDEDSLAPRLNNTNTVKPIDIAVIRFPRLSNFTDFAPLESHLMIHIRYVSAEKDLGQPDMIILPGTKSTMDDLLWMRQNGLESAITKRAAADTPILGICGGYQMLGRVLENREKIEGEQPFLLGMGLLPSKTTFTQQKTRTRVQGVVQADPWKGAKLDAYEIHMGVTVTEGKPFAVFPDGTTDGCVNGQVFGTYLHGLFDTGELTSRLVQSLCKKKGLTPKNIAPISRLEYAEQQYNLLADGVRNAMDMDSIYRILSKHNGGLHI